MTNGGGGNGGGSRCVHRAALADRVIDRAFDAHKAMLRESLRDAQAQLAALRSGERVRDLERRNVELEAEVAQLRRRWQPTRASDIGENSAPESAPPLAQTTELAAIDALISRFKARAVAPTQAAGSDARAAAATATASAAAAATEATAAAEAASSAAETAALRARVGDLQRCVTAALRMRDAAMRHAVSLADAVASRHDAASALFARSACCVAAAATASATETGASARGDARASAALPPLPPAATVSARRRVLEVIPKPLHQRGTPRGAGGAGGSFDRPLGSV
jgi:hypothetical protein